MSRPPAPLSAAMQWQLLAQIPRGQRPSAALVEWLTNPESLTAALVAKSQGQFQVRVLRQCLAVPKLHERKILGMKRPARALIREVILMGQGEPWVFARSVLPLSSLTGRLRHLRKQGTRPLGAFLFSQPNLARGPLTIAAISANQAYLPELLYGANPAALLWGRRSVFSVDAKPLLVSEVFLPQFCARLT